ncbi:MAG: DUF4162 domain-containing protein, partial [Muricauda sp.]|nr:DUF4162 domain-containing protein [Allomuricauda sp.]
RMESVEELCEYIALIHKSEKILDGKLSDIKKAYTKNIYNVGLQVNDDAKAKLDLIQGQWEILSSNLDSSENQLDFKVQLPSTQTTHILSQLSGMGNVNQFEEMVPSANDIFIQTVNNKENGK